MTWVNYDDVVRQIESAGIVIDKPLNVDCKIQRWKLVDGKGNEKPGWSRLKEWQSKKGHRYIVGCFGIWMGNDDGYTRIELPKRDAPDLPSLSDEEIAAAKAAQKAAQQAVAEERKREIKTAAAWAAQVWSKCAPAGEHEYLTRKQIGANGARVLGALDDLLLPGIDETNMWRLQKSAGALVVPMHDTNGNICGLQFIYPKGHDFKDKQFWPTGMAMGGTFGVIGGLRRSGVLLLAEGFATAASLHEATGQPVAYAFSANNIGKAAKQIRDKYKLLRILICADDDYLTEAVGKGNPGIDAAMLAASSIENADWIKPDFLDEAGNDLRNNKKLTDFNDLAVLTGLPIVVANQINAKLDALKWKDDGATSRAGNSFQGGGDDGIDPEGRRRAMSVMSIDDVVARFIPIDDGTGKSVFDTWTNKLASRDQMVALLPAGMRGDDVKRHPLYIQRGACYIDEIGFDPAGKDDYVRLNTWRGWPLKPKPGKCELLLDLIGYLCRRDPNPDESAAWLLKWMAYPLQNPGAKMQSAIIMHGPQGTGKSTVFRTYARLYGYRGNPHRNYAIVLDQKALSSNFNPDWDDKLFVLAEEVVNSADKWQLKNELKELVTGDTMRIEGKFLNAVHKKNRINMVFLSNENQPLPLDIGDRRHHVIYTPDALPKDFYAELAEELKGGGVEAFYAYLLDLDLTGFNEDSTPPLTDAKERLIAISAPSELRFVTEWISGDLGLPVMPALASDFYSAYSAWCRRNGESRPRPSNQFFGAIAHISGWEKKRCRIYNDLNFTGETVAKPLVIPPQKVLEAAGTALKQGESVSKWLTDCVFDFGNALSSGSENQWKAA